MKTSTFINKLFFRILVSSGLLLSSEIAVAQIPLWEDVDNIPLTAGTQMINPQKFRKVKLNQSVLKSILNQAVHENTLAAKTSSLTFDLPMPDGSMEQFIIVESPIMEPELAQKFPEIKTYAGYSVHNKAITGRFDLTSGGFHAIVFSPNGTFFIDPYSNTTAEFYISYDKKDYMVKTVFNCGVGTESLPEVASAQPKQNTIEHGSKAGRAINSSFGDGQLRTYRLALAATVEYATFCGGTLIGVMNAQITTMNRVNGIFIRDFAVKMSLVANNYSLIYLAEPDPYTNNNGFQMLSQNQNNLDIVIGSANYDIGHVFSTGAGGVANLGITCRNNQKARGATGVVSPAGDPFDVDYVAHEMAHQFGANHSFNSNCGISRHAATAFEPGSGSTIMSYASTCSPYNIQSNADAFFHGGNFPEIYSYITTGSGNTCAVKTSTSNVPPVISTYTNSQTIPKGTPFVLAATATDADGNTSLTYNWDQIDLGPAANTPSSTAINGPAFRSFMPAESGTRYFPRLSDLVTNTPSTWEVLPTVARNLNFRLIVRDNNIVAGKHDYTDINLTVDSTSGPFIVTTPNATGITWGAGSTKTVSWNVANTNLAPVSCTHVDILLSIDGGLTYPTVLVNNVPNTGTANITVPVISTTTARIMVRGRGRAFFDISNNNFTINCVIPPPTSVAVNSTAICTGNSVTLTATCGAGTITWFNQASGGTTLGTGNNFLQSPTVNTTYYAGCITACGASNRVSTGLVLVATPSTNLNLTTNYTTGNTLKIATQLLTASNKIIAPAGAVYRAGKSVTLNPGFEARNGSMFRAEIKGCN